MPVTISPKKKKPIGIPAKPENVPAAKPKGVGGFKRIYDLGEERVALLNDMFLKEVSVGKIIQTLQEGWEVFKDTQVPTLKKYLYRYKWEVLDKGLAVKSIVTEAAMITGDKKQMKLVQEILEDFDVLKEFHELAVVQKTRVRKLLLREADMPMLFNSLGNEMKTYADFLGRYSELAFDLGILKKVQQPKAGDVIVNVDSAGKDHVTVTMNQASQVDAAAKAFFDVLEEVSDVVSQ